MDESLKKVKATAGGSVYDILIGDGAFAETGGYASELLGRGFALFVNERVWELHGDYVRECVAAFPNHDVFVMPDGEEHKNYRHAGQALEWMLERHYSRGSCVLAVGGGVTGDFAGYVAALYMRGIPVIHAPTTLLAMVDSSAVRWRSISGEKTSSAPFISRRLWFGCALSGHAARAQKNGLPRC